MFMTESGTLKNMPRTRECLLMEFPRVKRHILHYDKTMTNQDSQRIVAVVGRPNVGKSALFNRIAGRRLSIVHEESGVTRDRVACEVKWKGERFELVDTGGISLMDGSGTLDRIHAGIHDQVGMAVMDAAVLILVVDVETGLVPLDGEVARQVREVGRPVIIAANKADNPGRDDHATEFERLGFPVFPVSALHNRGMDELMETVAGMLPPAIQSEELDALKVAVVGRPNVGKSSYINRLLRNERVIVSPEPGTTRDSIEIPFTVGLGAQSRRYLLIDTAGMRRKGRIRDPVERFSLMRAEKSIDRADVVLLMIDASDGPTSREKSIASMILEHNKGAILMVNKWDIAEDVTERGYTKALRSALPFMGFVPIVYVSAQSGYNIRKSIETIDYVASQVRFECSTGLLNRVLHDAFDRVQPPVVYGRRLKLYYATQTGVQPVRFRLFVNHPRHMSSSYESYLIKRLRSAFGLEGAPVVLQPRSHR